MGWGKAEERGEKRSGNKLRSLTLSRAHSLTPTSPEQDREPKDSYYPMCISLGTKVCLTAPNKIFSLQINNESDCNATGYTPFQDDI